MFDPLFIHDEIAKANGRSTNAPAKSWSEILDEREPGARFAPPNENKPTHRDTGRWTAGV